MSYWDKYPDNNPCDMENIQIKHDSKELKLSFHSDLGLEDMTSG